MVLDHAAINPDPFKRVGAFQTPDGKVHATVEEAFKSERAHIIEDYIRDLKYRSQVLEMDSNKVFYQSIAIREHFEPLLKILLDKGMVK